MTEAVLPPIPAVVLRIMVPAAVVDATLNYPVFGEKVGRPNYACLRLGPDAAISFGVRSRAPGDAMVGQEVEPLATQAVGEGGWARTSDSSATR